MARLEKQHLAIKSDVVESEKRTKNDSTASESRVLEAIKNLDKDLDDKLGKLDEKLDEKLGGLNEKLDDKLGKLTKTMRIGFIALAVAIVGCKVPNEGWKAFWVFVGIGSKLAG